MFNFPDPLSISTMLDVFMLLVSGRKRRIFIGSSIGVEDPDCNCLSAELSAWHPLLSRGTIKP